MNDPQPIRMQLHSLAGKFTDNRRTKQFADAANEPGLSTNAQTLAIAEEMNDGTGHDFIFRAYISLGGRREEYDPARWELLRAGYPANRGW